MSSPTFLEFGLCGVDKSASLEEWRQALAAPEGKAGSSVKFVAAFQLAYQGFPLKPTPKYTKGAPDEERRYGGLVYPAWDEIKNYVEELKKDGLVFSFHLNETTDCPYVSGLLQGKPEYYDLVRYIVEVYNARHIQVNITAHGVDTGLFDCSSDSPELRKSIFVLRTLAEDFPECRFIVPIAEIKKKDKDGTVIAKIRTMPFFQKLLEEQPVPQNICGFFDSSAGTGTEPDKAPEVPPGYPNGEQYCLGFTGGINSENVKMWLDRYSERADEIKCNLISDAQSGFRQERNRGKPIDVAALLKLSQGVREWAKERALASAAPEGLHPSTCAAILKDVKGDEGAAEQRLIEISNLLKSPELQAQLESITNDLDAKLQLAANAALKQHKGDDPERFKKCTKTLQLMGILNQGFGAVKELLLACYPKNLDFEDEEGQLFKFELSPDLDKEGRATWRGCDCCIAWNQGKFGGSWAAFSSKDQAYGKQAKWSPLPFDAGGIWVKPMELEPKAPLVCVRCKADDMPKLAQKGLGDKELVESTLADIMELDAPVKRPMVKILEMLYRGLEHFNGGYSDKLPGKAEDGKEDRLRLLLTRLAGFLKGMTDNGMDKLLGAELPGFPFELSYVQVMIINCRLFGISRLRNTSFPITPVLVHDFVARAWLQGKENLCRYLNLETQQVTECAPPPKKEGFLRFVVVSDTHGWSCSLPDTAKDADSRDKQEKRQRYCRLLLPEGDVLLHCGDFYNEGSGLTRRSEEGEYQDPDADNLKVQEELDTLKAVSVERDESGEVRGERGNKFLWCFLVGGNHDAPLHMLAAEGKLRSLLGDSVVLMQTPVDFDSPIPLDTRAKTSVQTTAKSAATESKMTSGAVRICHDGSLLEPGSVAQGGVVIAGSGLSLSNNAWSANRAFQVQKTDEAKLKAAAEGLLKYNPDVIFSHGPPDPHLKARLDADDCTAKLHFYGHSHTYEFKTDDRKWSLNGQDYPGRCFVNAASVTQLYLPTRRPLVFDLPALK